MLRRYADSRPSGRRYPFLEAPVVARAGTGGGTAPMGEGTRHLVVNVDAGVFVAVAAVATQAPSVNETVVPFPCRLFGRDPR
jgi:hypothetical protein